MLMCLSFVTCGKLGDDLDKGSKENVSGENGSHEGGDSGSKTEMVVSGFVQKGQFSMGSQVTIFGLNENLLATGNSWPSNIKDASGSFTIAVSEPDTYMEVRAQGYYFNELTGNVSDGQIVLEAIVDPSSDRVNVNLLTHLVRPRIIKLLEDGMSYSAARAQAESELVTSLGYSALNVSFDQLDITKSREGDALLLALACVLQQNRTTGELVTFINEMSMDFVEDGCFSEDVLAEIEAAKPKVDISDVCENMQVYYGKYKMSNAVVPEFYRYLLDDNFFAVVESEFDGMKYSYDGGEKAIKVRSSVEFTVESDVDWIELSRKHLRGPDYMITLTVRPNNSDEDRTGKIIFKDAQGNVRAEYVIEQGSNLVTLTCMLEFKSSDIKSDMLLANGLIIKKDDEVDVNGRTYPVVWEGDWFTVSVRAAESYTVTYPAGRIVYQSDGSCLLNNPSTTDSRSCGIFQGVTNGFDECRLVSQTALIKADLSAYPDWTYMVFGSKDNEAVICGDMTVNPDGTMSFEQDGGREIRINRVEDDTLLYIPVFPCTLNGITLTVYCSDGQWFTKTSGNVVAVTGNRVYNLGNIPAPR